MNPRIPTFYRRVAEGELTVVVVNNLFTVPLFGFYVFVLDMYDPSDIKGTLMDCPLNMIGPFEDFFEAKEYADGLVDDTPPLDNMPQST